MNYPPGMSDNDWRHVNGEHLQDDEHVECADCRALMYAEEMFGEVCAECLAESCEMSYAEFLEKIKKLVGG